MTVTTSAHPRAKLLFLSSSYREVEAEGPTTIQLAGGRVRIYAWSVRVWGPLYSTVPKNEYGDEL